MLPWPPHLTIEHDDADLLVAHARRLAGEAALMLVLRRGPVPHQGILAAWPLPRLLHLLHVQRLTGVLQLGLPEGSAEIYLHTGQPVAVELPIEVDRLGQVLVASGLLDEETVRRTMQVPRPPGVRYGRMLVDAGIIQEAQLRAALRLQIRRRLHRLFFHHEGRFSVDDRGLEGRELVHVHPYRTIAPGLRAAWDEARLRAALGDGPFRLLAPLAAMEPYGFSAAELQLIELLRAPRTTTQLHASFGGAGLALVAALLFTDALEVPMSTPMLLRPEATQRVSVVPPAAPAAATPAAVPSGPRRITVPAVARARAEATVPSLGRTAPELRTPTTQAPVAPLQREVFHPPRVPAGASMAPRAELRTPTAQTAVPPIRGEAAHRPPVIPAGASMTRLPPRTPTLSTQAAVPPVRSSSSARPHPVTRPPERSGPLGADDFARAIASKLATLHHDDYFQLLGVGRSATREQLKVAWLQAAQLYHPDRLSAAGQPQLRADAERIFRRISEAYNTLSDDVRRAAYLERLGRPSTEG